MEICIQKMSFKDLLIITCLFFTNSVIQILSGNGNTSETVIINAAFEDVASCPCDLSFGSCDFGCCCDWNCSTDEQKTFTSCITFLPDGQTAETQQCKCSSNHHNKVDWFPFLGIVFKYTAFLKYYYDWQYKMANKTKIFMNKLYTAVFYCYRKLIINWLNALMPSNVLGRRVYNDVKNREYLINSLREDLSKACLLSEYFLLGLSPVDKYTGAYYNITNDIHLNILCGEWQIK